MLKKVLNLIINGLPSIHETQNNINAFNVYVLNLIINGLPSILNSNTISANMQFRLGFKPYYKWITFNTKILNLLFLEIDIVLNLIINGLPSIQELIILKVLKEKFQVLNLIINGLPSILYLYKT